MEANNEKVWNCKGTVYSKVALESWNLIKHNGDIYHVIELDKDFVYLDSKWVEIGRQLNLNYKKYTGEELLENEFCS